MNYESCNLTRMSPKAGDTSACDNRKLQIMNIRKRTMCRDALSRLLVSPFKRNVSGIYEKIMSYTFYAVNN